MKTPFLFLISFLWITNTLSAAKINIEIINGSQQLLIYYTPKVGDYYFASRKEENTDELGKYTIEVEMTEPGFYYIYPVIDFKSDNWNGIQVYVTPDANISIQLEKDNPRSTLLFSGDHKEINTFLGQRERHFYLTIGEEEKLKKYYSNKDPETCYKVIQSYKNLELDDLGKIKEVNESAKKMIAEDIDLYYQTAFLRLIYLFGEVENESTFKLKPSWLTFLNSSSFLESRSAYAPSSMWYMDHLNLKTVIYHANNTAQFDKAFHKDSKAQEKWDMYELIFTKKEMEKKLGNYLYHTMSKNQLDEKNLFLYEKFKEQFPNYPHLDVISAPFEKQMTFNNKGDNDSFKYRLAEKRYESISQILEDSKAAYVYFDIWATWCGPCIEEFSHARRLNEYAKTHPNKIEVIYISIDEKKPIASIEKVINFNNLEGRHILAFNALQKEIVKQFGTGGTIKIPAYFIMKKDGQIINKSASRPSQWTDLKKEFDELE